MNDFYSLDLILKEMIFKRKEKPLVYKRYSNLLISDRNQSVINFTINAIIMCFLPNPVPEEELIFSDPNAVSSFFINLCEEYQWIVLRELTDPMATRRYRMALIFRSLFSLKKSLPTINVCKELFTERMSDIWREFEGLLSDTEPNVRIVCIQAIDVLLETQIDEQIVSDLVSNLIRSLRDVEELIRCESVSVVDHCHQSENILNHNLMRHFVARIGDRELPVRERTLVSVSNVFHTINKLYTKTELFFVYKLSTACLLRYPLIDDEEEKGLIELVFNVNLCDIKADPMIKMQNLIKLMCKCDDIAVQTISQILHNQHRLRTLFAKLVVAVQKHDLKKSIISINYKVYESLAKAFEYIDGADQVLKNFHLLLKDCDREVLSDVMTVFQTKTSLDSTESMAAIDRLFVCQQESVNVGQNETLMALKEEIMCRLGVGLIDKNCLIELFGLMDDINGVFAQRLSSFIIILSKCYSNYFSDNESVIVNRLLGLPHIILAFIGADSVLPFMQCSQQLKQMITDSVNKVFE